MTEPKRTRGRPRVHENMRVKGQTFSMTASEKEFILTKASALDLTARQLILQAITQFNL